MSIEPISAAYKAASLIARTVPRPVADATAEVGSAVAAMVRPQRRILVERNLRRVYGPNYSGLALRRSVHETFRSYARYWIDSFRLPDMTDEQLDAGHEFYGFGHILDARANGFGPLIVLPHLGGWEWSGFWLTRIMNIPVTVVVEPVEPPELFEFFAGFRRELGMNIVPLGPNAGAEILRAIKDRHVVCLLTDRDIQGDGIPVHFFGEKTTMPAGPATLALRTGAPILTCAVFFNRDKHRTLVQAPLPAERQGRFRDDVARVTQDIADRLAALIRTAPEQWHLQQPNWPSDHEALAAMGFARAEPEAPASATSR